jgi:hypothetical protein
MNSTTTSKLMLGVLALGGLVAFATPAAADDYDNYGRDDGNTIRVPYNDTVKGVVIVPGPAPANDDNHGNNTVVKLQSPTSAKNAPAAESIAEAVQRRARQAAADEARRLRD